VGLNRISQRVNVNALDKKKANGARQKKKIIHLELKHDRRANVIGHKEVTVEDGNQRMWVMNLKKEKKKRNSVNIVVIGTILITHIDVERPRK